jgi:tetratricopeptide (TPR) repeat protein
MGRRNIICVSALIVAVFCGVGLCLENPSVGNPVGSGTVPPTAYRPGLVKSQNPIDMSGNLVMTGNVANGMQFRGVVPYNSPTSFYAPASSLQRTSGGMDSFLRNTVGTQDFRTSSGGLTPYYSPTWTVTTTQPGEQGVVTTGGSGTNSFAGTNLPGPQMGYYRPAYNTQINKRPLSMSQEDLEKLVDTDVTKYPKGGEADSQSQDQFWRDMGVKIERKEEAANITKPGPEQATNSEPSLEKLLGDNTQGLQRSKDKQRVDKVDKKKESLTSPLGEETQKPGQVADMYEQMKGRLGKTIELPKSEGVSATKRAEANESTASGPGVTQAEFEKAYKSFAVLSNDKFNQHIRAAEGYMKEGRFYRAADAYTLASIYKPKDPLGYAGKSVALFASGEYLSSSLFLARALEIFPEYAKVKIDLVGMIGDKDTVENRILEARDWMDKSDSGELEFLLSYIYYQMDRLEFARQSIETAAKKMPDSPAVAAMKKAIDERLAKP